MCLIQASNVHTQQYFFSGLVSDSMWPKNDEIAKDWDFIPTFSEIRNG